MKMNNILAKVFLIGLLSVLFIVPFSVAAPLHPVNTIITEVIPTTVNNGGQVEIIGTNFGSAASNNAQVVISGGILGKDQQIPQQIINWSDTSIKFIVSGTQWGSHVPYIKWIDEQTHNSVLTGWTAASFRITNLSCPADQLWTCTTWGICSANGEQTRSCTENIVGTNCAPRPPITQSCTAPRPPPPPPPLPAPAPQPSPSPPPTPALAPPQPSPSLPVPQTTCTEDIWSCTELNRCSANGIQTRSCRRTFDCPSVETAPPATSQTCQTPITQPQYQQDLSPDRNINLINDNDRIIKSTVRLVCPYQEKNKTKWMQGSGTVISSGGQILTNRHLIESPIDGSLSVGCLAGFTNDPEQGIQDYRVAWYSTHSNNLDAALLQLDKSYGNSFTFVNRTGDGIKLRLGKTKFAIWGYPAIGGEELTFTDGNYSGKGSSADPIYNENFIKTDAKIDHGNSGGGAYTQDGFFIGMPTLGRKLSSAENGFESLGYILKTDKINSWLSGAKFSTSSSIGAQSQLNLSLFEEFDSSQDINPPDLSNARVIIYSDKTKNLVLPSPPGQKQTKNKPLFQFISIEDESGVAGYYVYFGSNINADPVKQGKFIKKTTYSPSTIKKKGVYYFILKAKDENDNISDSYITEYRYKR